MRLLSRRDFLEFGAELALAMGLGAAAAPAMAEGLEELAAGRAPVLWLQAQSCSGCSVSFLNSHSPSPAEVLTRHISLTFHSTLSTATGQVAMQAVHDTIKAGAYILVIEGSMPSAMPAACVMGEENLTDLVATAAAGAQAVLAVGSCAAFGGIPAAEGNPTGAQSVGAFLKAHGIEVPTINLPGCPCHPEWLVGTLVHALQFGMPEMDDLHRPTAFYGSLIHDNCPRFPDYERERFAKNYGERGCLFELGCMGPKTHADCTLRNWNNGVNTCIKAGAPCIGCAAEFFAASAALPFRGQIPKA